MARRLFLGCLREDTRFYTEIVPNCKAVTLKSIIKGRTDIESIIHSDGWRGYYSLVDFDYKKYLYPKGHTECPSWKERVR